MALGFGEVTVKLHWKSLFLPFNFWHIYIYIYMVILSGGAVKMLFKHIAEKMKDVDAMVTVALQ